MNLVKRIRNWTRTEVSIFVVQKWWCLSELHHRTWDGKGSGTGHIWQRPVAEIPEARTGVLGRRTDLLAWTDLSYLPIFSDICSLLRPGLHIQYHVQ